MAAIAIIAAAAIMLPSALALVYAKSGRWALAQRLAKYARR